MQSEALLLTRRIPNPTSDFPLPDASHAAPPTPHSLEPPPFFLTAPAAPRHRRGHSELAFRISEDLHLDAPGVSPSPAAESSGEIGSEGDFFSAYIDLDKVASQLDEGGSGSESAPRSDVDPAERPKHRHSSSLDVSSMTSSKRRGVFGEVMEAKKAMPPEKLAELAVTDPKKAKRILANRQSAARSKQRKVHYTLELEQKVQRLQTEATTLSAQLTLFQRDITELGAENTGLKLWLQNIEQQAQLCERSNDALRQEIQRLNMAIGGGSVEENCSLSLLLDIPYSSVFELGPPFPQPQLVEVCSPDLIIQQNVQIDLSDLEFKGSNNVKPDNSLSASDSCCNSVEGPSYQL